MGELIYATTNQYKLSTANTILQRYADVTLVGLPEDVPDIPEIQPESQEPQEEVAIDKSRKYYDVIKQPLIVMDSGLFIKGLNGFPGVYTKYVLETIGIEGLIRLIKPLKNRAAYTMRTIAYTDGVNEKTFSSRVDGVMQTQKQGTNGRDYDLIFLVPEKNKTIAELTDDEKSNLTSSAWKELAAWVERTTIGEKNLDSAVAGLENTLSIGDKRRT